MTDSRYLVYRNAVQDREDRRTVRAHQDLHAAALFNSQRGVVIAGAGQQFEKGCIDRHFAPCHESRITARTSSRNAAIVASSGPSTFSRSRGSVLDALTLNQPL